MAEIRPEIETFANIKVVGIGGSGGSAVNRMVASKIRGVQFIAMNTDVQALHYSQAAVKLHIGKTVTRGLGAGMDPEIGSRAAEESQNEIREALKGADMVFITCGLGGGTGSGAGPKVAEIAKEMGALTVAVVTRPFIFEGQQRKVVADAAYDRFCDVVDTIITIPNDRVLQIIDRKTSLLDAFEIVDDVLRQGVQGISELITVPGLINVDFADVRSIMANRGSALMGIGRGSGENRSAEAAKAAIASPLLEVSIDGAKGILFTITGGSNLGMYEVSEAAKVITQSADTTAKIIFGAIIDEAMKDEVKVTVVATGFDGRSGGPKKSGIGSGVLHSNTTSAPVHQPSAYQAPSYQAPFRPAEPLESVSFAASRSVQQQPTVRQNVSTERSVNQGISAQEAYHASLNSRMSATMTPAQVQTQTPQQQVFQKDEYEKDVDDEVESDVLPEPHSAPTPAPAARQPHVQAPQYAPTSTQRPTPTVMSNRSAVKSDEEELEIPAFIRRKMM
ncbi:cell division protein FtsZ [Candidatus Uhrbacteria bacterium]|nr:cell division protein FtsZ [Candidatus Uhrbacteria bacterium]